VLSQPVVGYSGWLEPKYDRCKDSERRPWMDIYSDHILVQIVGDASIS
jgi:hypothetical protein